MKTVFYSKDAQFDLTDNEFEAFINKANSGERVFIPRLKVFLSNMFIWAGDKPLPIRGKLHDGTIVIKDKFGKWIDEKNPTVKLDYGYFPELANDTVEIIENKLSTTYPLDTTTV